jgi:sugar phosphate isomerase/epimerase
MYSVRESFRADPLGTVDRVAELGYRSLEFFTHDAYAFPGVAADVSASALRARMERAGVTPVGAHIAPFADDTIDAAIAYHTELGTASLGMSIDFWTSRSHVLERCAAYNRYGEKCRAAGLQFYYHNHYHEFQTFDHDQVLDLIMDNTDPELVKFELDAYWTLRGAVDPAAVLRAHPGRFLFVHQKDFPFAEVRHLDLWAQLDRSAPLDRAAFEAAIRPEDFTEIGDGLMKVQDIVDASIEAGASHILVEQDHGRGKTEFERIARSMANMRRMRDLDWN